MSSKINHILVLLHGYGGNRGEMLVIEQVVKSWRIFSKILNLDLYSGIKYTTNTEIVSFEGTEVLYKNDIVGNARNLIQNSVEPNKSNIIHFLGYSMGGLVTRALNKAVIQANPSDWLWQDNSPQIGSIVQLASPNNGTDPVRFARNPSQAGLAQIEQMRPDGEFIQWLNSSPNYINEIPHFLMIGSFNIDQIAEFDGLVFHSECKMEGIGNMSLDTYKWEVNHFNIVDWSQRTYEGAFIEQKMFGIYNHILQSTVLKSTENINVRVF